MEFCEDLSLDKYLNKNGNNLLESELFEYFTQIVKSLAYLHSKKIAHLDLKPGNIFINK